MIDVKLVSASSVPGQKGSDAWLQTWRLGQRFSGQVLSQPTAGEALIRIGGHQIAARAPFTLPPGVTVRFEVTALQPMPQLKILPEVSVSAENSGALERQLRVLLPLQESIAAPLARLFLGADSAKLLSLLGLGNDASKSLQSLLPQLRLLTDPAELQALMLNSGVFGRAAQVAGTDLRMALLRLLQRIQLLDGKAAGSGVSSLPEATLESLGKELRGALATIVLNQLAMSQGAERAAYMWLFDLPFQWRERAGSLSLRIERERRRSAGGDSDDEDDNADDEGWQVTLQLNLQGLGAVEVGVYEKAGRLSLVLKAERETTRQLLSDHLPVLQQALEQRGLDVALIRCYMGEYSPPPGPVRWGSNVSVSA